MDIPGLFVSTTIGAAVNFIFNELQEILKEMRAESRETKEPAKTETPEQRESRENVLRWALKARIDFPTEAEIKGLLEIIEIYKQNRIRSLKVISKMGGENFASPPQIAALNDAEEGIKRFSQELIKKIEQLYGSSITVSIS
jgi:hypothetical protein